MVSEDLNTKLKNKPFKEKKQILLNSGFDLPGEMKATTNWGAAEIRQRTRGLAERAYGDAWKL